MPDQKKLTMLSAMIIDASATSCVQHDSGRTIALVSYALDDKIRRMLYACLCRAMSAFGRPPLCASTRRRAPRCTRRLSLLCRRNPAAFHDEGGMLRWRGGICLRHARVRPPLPKRIAAVICLVVLGLSLAGCTKCGWLWDEGPRTCHSTRRAVNSAGGGLAPLFRAKQVEHCAGDPEQQSQQRILQSGTARLGVAASRS